jgi:hypothetical protein
MANGIFNLVKGKYRYYLELPAASDALVIVLVKAAGLEVDSTLADYDTLAAILAGSNDEADFTNYSRKILTSGITTTVDDTNNRVDSDIPDQTWTAAGGVTNNTLGKFLVGYDPATGTGTDADIVPLSYHDFSATTDGNDLVAQVSTAGLLRAQ